MEPSVERSHPTPLHDPHAMQTITIQLSILELILAVAAQTLSMAGVGVWFYRTSQSAISKAKADAAIEVARLDKAHAIDRKQFTQDLAAAQTKVDFVMEVLRERAERSGDTGSGSDVESIDLYRKLVDRYSLDDLQGTAYKAGIRWDSIAGETIDTRAANLISAARARKKLARLAAIVREERPD